MKMGRTVRYGAVVVIAAAALFEFTTHVGRGWWRDEPFYDNRPASYWRVELQHWQYG